MEELDLKTNNLCITEDAFEQFQSVAMYEEDEFITLSDIVSSPHTNQDANEILHDDPCDEVVSLSIQDEKTVNNINIPPFEQNKIFDVNSQIKDKNNKDKTRTSKRRGRKKKGSIENSDVQQTQSEIDLNKPTKPKRQSRKSVIAADTSGLKYVEECVIEEPKDVPVTGKGIKPANKAKRKSRNSLSRKEKEEKVIKKQGKQAKRATKKLQKESLNESENKIITSTIEDSNISISTSTTDNKKNKHKRGRKKRNPSCIDPVLDDTEVAAKLCDIKSITPTKKQNDELETSIPTMPLYDENNKGLQVENKPNLIKKKNIKNSIISKSVKNDTSEEDIEDLPLSNLSRKTDNELHNNVDTTTLEIKDIQCTTTLDNKNLTETNMYPKNSTSNGTEIIVKKRGRPKKITNNSHAKSDLEAKKTTSENIEKFDTTNDLSMQEHQNKYDNSEIISEPVICPDNEPQVPDSSENIDISTESNSQSKRNSKKKLIPDFEYNVDSVVKTDKPEDIPKPHEDLENLDTEDSTRRPVRRRVLKNWNYDEGSDEDPYANVESSDEEPRRRKKGGRCYSDDEYFPGDKRHMIESESDMAIDEDDLGLNNRPTKKKKSRKSDLVISNKSPRKKGRKSDAESICTTEKTNTDSGDVDFEDYIDSSGNRGNDDQVTPIKSKKDSQTWGNTNEFENFIAKIVQGTDIKISKKSVDKVKTSLQIPVIEATEAKKSIEKSAQTVTVNTKPACVQTDTAYEIPMKDQVPLTGEQSEKACDFLSSIVQTTAELGQLMTQKSEDFITKKINTKYVTDTFKMDYCVKKSFLLFKLAKHNLVQMEEDLSKQYEEFLRDNNLIQHRQEQKIMASTSKASDSDCEIVEEPVKKTVPPKTQKPAFNPKTVFLNKELSIKIAKKPTEEPAPKKKIDIKGRHSVWINDSVLVKKVKPNQSFLAQDSRNKKPPDNKITLEEVNNFFKMYERQKALFICAPYVKTEWFGKERKYMCNYFIDSAIDFPEKTVVLQNENAVTEVAFVEHDSNHVIGISKPKESVELCPETLSLLCTKIVQNCLHPTQHNTANISNQYDLNQCEDVKADSQRLTNIVVEETHLLISDINKNIICLNTNFITSIHVQPLKTLCFKRVTEFISKANLSDGKSKHTSDNVKAHVADVVENDTNSIIKVNKNTATYKQIKPSLSLLCLCVKAIQESQDANFPRNINYVKYTPKSLKSITLNEVQKIINGTIVTNSLQQKQSPSYNLDSSNISPHGNSISNNTTLEQHCYIGKTLLQLCIDALNISSYGNSVTSNAGFEQKYYNAETLIQIGIDAINIPSHGNSITNNSLKPKSYNVKTLLQLCLDLQNISSFGNSISDNTSLEQNSCNGKTLLQKSLGAPNISSYGNSNTNDTDIEEKCCNRKTLPQLSLDAPNISSYGKSVANNTSLEQKYCNAKTLLQCKDAPNISLNFNKTDNLVEGEPHLEHKNPEVYSVLTLKSICCNKIAELSTEWYKRQRVLHDIKLEKTTLNFTINNVNTVSDDIFLDAANDNDLDDVDNDNYVESINQSYNEEEQHNYSDVDCGAGYDELGEDDNNWVSQVQMQVLRPCLDTKRDIEIKDKIKVMNENKGQDSFVQIKLEPNEYQPEIVDSSNIKAEPADDHEYMEESNNYSSINIITKQESIIEEVRKGPILRQNSNSYDEELFESFISSNKMILSLNDNGSTSDEIFSQSSQRIRKQHEPDSKDEIDVLTDTMNLLVPQNVECKDRLIESSQEEDDEEYKKSGKKKNEKRKCKSKKNTKDLPMKGKILQKNEITAVTKKMRKKIRQEHDKSDSSDSDPDCLKLSLKTGKEKSTQNKFNNDLKRKEEEEKVIQCNDVDSTEVITENNSNLELQNNKKDLDPEDNNESISDERSFSPLIDYNDPVEVECEPALPIFDELINNEPQQEPKDTSDTTSPVDRQEWNCYPIDSKDSKIYSHAHVQLDKLPTSFVETYFKYQDMTDKTKEDIEVDKLTHQQSLNNPDKSKPKIVIIEEKIKVPDTSELIESNEKELKKEDLDELFPSADESTSNVDIHISPTPLHFTKNILMNEDNDTEKSNVEAESTIIKIEKTTEQTYTTRSGRTVKCKVEQAELEKEDMMLTADKMMNKELALLHAPVELKEEREDAKESIQKVHNKNAQKNASKGQTTRHRIKTDDDSSSEEEKQWFTTKEKLLKRLLKKNEDTNVEDAKRAKIVSEFIEKRGELPEPRQRVRARRGCSKKTIMERRKQIKILSRELFGVDTVHSKKYSQASTSKGRRNIRKVIDKKSLARSTVVANMEEFERKRRLTILQGQLREELGCEEGENVVVINDELCLEYDFENKRPVVSVHQFFTKVMKAHQYEGVKFMWDACFESVSLTGGGSAGGGCILAHCMGLGKTLQVLALLHTVLTHPEVGMRRVLVCCPLSTVLNWVDEIHKWIGPVTNHIKVFELSKLKKTYERAYQLEDWYNGGGIFIIGYELFRSLSTLDPVLDCVRPTIVNKIRTALLDPGPDIVVCDEGHLLKNDCSVLAVAMSRVATKRRIILTGTPMQNNLREYYCMVNFVKPNLLGSYSEYSNRFENPIMNGQHRDSREEDIKLMKARTHILHKVLEGCLQRQEASVLYPYLPKKYEYTVFISLTKCQWELYKHYLTHYINTKESKQSVLRDFHVLQKIWTHPLVLNNFMTKIRDDEKEPKMKAEKLEDECEESPEQAIPSAAAWWAATDHRHMLHQLDSSYKFLVVFQLLRECVALGDKVLIFSTSLYAMDALEFFLNRENKWTLGREYYRLDGSVPPEVRQKWCREFNAPQNTNTKLFLISTRAGCLGLNMTAANRVIILDTSWNPAHDIQSIFRVYRFGQKKDCYIYRLVAMGTMEQKIYERSVTKQAVACRVVDEQQIDRHYNMAELSELYRLDEEGSGISAGLAAGVRDTALLRVAAAAAGEGGVLHGGGGLHAVHEHDSLLRGSSESVLPEHERNAAWMQFQQEHATTHIRNFDINVPTKVEDTNPTKIEPKKESEINTDETTPKKTKKGKRKSKTKNIEPEPHPSTSEQNLSPEMEESMIKKIMNILITHNFHTTKSPEDISALLQNVRDVVAITPKRIVDDMDPLTGSIARVLLENENISFPEVKSEQTDNNVEYHEALDDEIDLLEMGSRERKRRRNRIDSDEEYLPDTRKRKPSAKTNTRKSNESVYSDSNYDALDSVTENTDVISNKEVLEEEPVVIRLKRTETTISDKPTESNYIVKIEERTSKKGNKKVKNVKTEEKKEKQLSNVNETIAHESINESTNIISNEEVLENEEKDINLKKSETIAKKPAETSHNLKINEKTSKQSNKKFKIAKNDVKKEKLKNNIIITLEKETLNESTETITSPEVLEKVLINLQKSETLSKKPSITNHILRADEETLNQSNKKIKDSKNDVRKEEQQNNIYVMLEDDSSNEGTETVSSNEKLEDEPVVKSLKKPEILSKKPSESNQRVERVERTGKPSNRKVTTAKKDKLKENQTSNIYETIENDLLNENTETISSKEVLEKNTVVLSMKKSGTISKEPSESIHISKAVGKTLQQSHKKNKIAKNDEKEEKQQSNIYFTVDDESSDDNTATVSNNEMIEDEPVVISLKESETLSKEPSESNKLVKKVERKLKQSNKEVTTPKKDVPKEKQTSKIYETIENESSNECIEIDDNCDTDNSAEKAPEQPPENESICLSDDDEPIITEPAPNKEERLVEKIKKEETIPLHKSVLTNKNFIKLVAHTYLSGNPMLDEDAAVLAAQYSTLKALKEVQATGKDLTSGPIHDIAMKVLGIELMKRLFVANPHKNNAETMLLETENIQNKTTSDTLVEKSKLQKPVASKVNENPEPETKIIHKRKLGILRKANLANEDKEKASQSTTKSSQETISPEATTTKVVPVGIFKSPVPLSSQRLSLEECILPDDDEVIITTPPAPPPAEAQLARRNSKQLVVNTVSSRESNRREHRSSYVEELVPIASVSVASRSTGQSATNNTKPAKASLPSTIENSTPSQNITEVQNLSKSDVNAAVNIKKNTAQVSDLTICLDSDEEDIPSVVCAKNFNKTITSSDSRTLVVSPLVKNSGKNSGEINDSKNISIPATNVNTPNLPKPATKTRTASVDQRKKVVIEVSAPKDTERKCKPGDIIRINETGQVQVLKRITGSITAVQAVQAVQAARAAQSRLANLKENISERNLKKLISPTATSPSSKEKIETVSNKANVSKEVKRKEIPSTSKQQKESDPLSIIKNVVHIPAFQYENTRTPKSQVEKTIQTPLPSDKEVPVNTKLQYPKLEVKPVITFNTHQVIINNDKQTTIKKKNIPIKSISLLKTNEGSKPQSDASKEFVIDLTRSQNIQIKKTSVSTPNEKTTEKNTANTGTIKTSSGGSDLKKSTTLVGKTVSKVAPKSSSCSTAPSTSDAKRSSPWSEGAQSKKLKTESKKKLTLSDFNLDDFDDIIELE